MSDTLRDRKIDVETGDVVTENGAFVWVEGLDAIEQRIRLKMRLFRGESRLEQDKGLPFEEIYGKQNSLGTVEIILTDYILDTPGVLGLKQASEVQFDASARKLNVTMYLRTVYGDLTTSQGVAA